MFRPVPSCSDHYLGCSNGSPPVSQVFTPPVGPSDVLLQFAVFSLHSSNLFLQFAHNLQTHTHRKLSDLSSLSYPLSTLSPVDFFLLVETCTLIEFHLNSCRPFLFLLTEIFFDRMSENVSSIISQNVYTNREVKLWAELNCTI